MKNIINKDLLENIQYHIDNDMILYIERSFGDEIDIIQGFPQLVSDSFLLMTVINDFHDEGFTTLRLTDITDAYSKESDSFYEKVCIDENIGIRPSSIIKNIKNLPNILEQLKKYDGLISIQCEEQIKKSAFYLGKIINVEKDCVLFEDVNENGEWEEEKHKIPFRDITQITYGDNYSKIFYKYTRK